MMPQFFTRQSLKLNVFAQHVERLWFKTDIRFLSAWFYPKSLDIIEYKVWGCWYLYWHVSVESNMTVQDIFVILFWAIAPALFSALILIQTKKITMPGGERRFIEYSYCAEWGRKRWLSRCSHTQRSTIQLRTCALL